MIQEGKGECEKSLFIMWFVVEFTCRLLHHLPFLLYPILTVTPASLA